MTEVAISIHNLKKSYGKFVAIDEIDFEVRRGEIFGLLGPNGAGKTTTLECLEGLRIPDSGSMRIEGIDPVNNLKSLHNIIGVQLQTSGLPATMTVEEAMRFFCAYHGVTPNYELLERFGLKGKLGAQYDSLSTGLQRRLALALALAYEPPIVIMDEPTAGLDVPSRVELHEIMNELRGKGVTILLATHDMAEAEKLADRVAILLRGKIVTTGAPRALTAASSTLTKVMISTTKNSLLMAGLVIPGTQSQEKQDEYYTCLSTEIGVSLKYILVHLEENNDSIIDLRVERPSLEERFLEITMGKSG